ASDTYAKFRSRMGGFPDAFGMLPSNVIAHEINEPGEGQLRALFTLAANPMLSAPDPVGLADAFSRLELHVSIDLFLSNTARYADFVLPAVTFPEREDISIGIEMLQLASFVDYSERIVPPRGQAREDWKILDDIARAAGFAPYSSAPMRFLSRFGWRPEPMTMVDALLRLGPHGDLFGLRPHGISVKKLRRNRPELLADRVPTRVLRKRIRHRDHRVHLDPPEIRGEVAALGHRNRVDLTEYPLTLVGLRERHTMNSWMHNNPVLMKAGREQTARLHPKDAADAGVADGDLIRVTSPTGSIEI